MEKSKGYLAPSSYSIGVSGAGNSEKHIKRPMLVDDISFSSCPKEFKVTRDKRPRKWNHLQVRAEADRIRYEGSNFGERSAATLPYRYAVALLDTNKHTIQLFDPELFVCHRIIKKQESLVSQPTETSSTEKDNISPSDYLKSRMLLGESFGTKKTKQKLSSLERNKIDMEQLATQSSFISHKIDTSINRISEEQDQKDIGNSVMVESDPTILPLYDSKTKNVAEIYKMQDLIPHDVYYSLHVEELVNALEKKTSEDLKNAMVSYQFDEAVESRLKTLASMTILPERGSLIHTLRCLMYLNHLLHFRVLNESKINGDLSKLLPMATTEIISALPRHFAEPVVATNGKQRFKLSSFSKDRLAVHICILILSLDGFRTNVARLSTSLRLGATKTAEYMKAIGCTLERPESHEPSKFVAPGTSREIQVKMAVLRAPLNIILSKSRKGLSSFRK